MRGVCRATTLRDLPSLGMQAFPAPRGSVFRLQTSRIKQSIPVHSGPGSRGVSVGRRHRAGPHMSMPIQEQGAWNPGMSRATCARGNCCAMKPDESRMERELNVIKTGFCAGLPTHHHHQPLASSDGRRVHDEHRPVRDPRRSRA